jgi:hypothetical protein
VCCRRLELLLDFIHLRLQFCKLLFHLCHLICLCLHCSNGECCSAIAMFSGVVAACW